MFHLGCDDVPLSRVGLEHGGNGSVVAFRTAVGPSGARPGPNAVRPYATCPRADAGKAIGRSGDGGIDGIIKEDKLGLDVVYIQAKRWDNSAVGRPEVMQFAGALPAQKASKGSASAFQPEHHSIPGVVKLNLPAGGPGTVAPHGLKDIAILGFRDLLRQVGAVAVQLKPAGLQLDDG